MSSNENSVLDILLGMGFGVAAFAGALWLVDFTTPKYKMCITGATIAINELNKFGMIEASEVNILRAADNMVEKCKVAAE